MTTAEEIGKILKQKRKDKNLAQHQLAILAFNDKRYQSLISRVENGQYKDVKFEDITLILSGLEIDLLELIQNAK